MRDKTHNKHITSQDKHTKHKKVLTGVKICLILLVNDGGTDTNNY